MGSIVAGRARACIAGAVYDGVLRTYDARVTPDATRKLFEELSRHAWALSALGVAAQRGLFARLVEAPATAVELADAGSLDLTTTHAILDVVIALGLASKDAEHVALDDGLRAYLGEVGAATVGHDAISTLAAAFAPLRASAQTTGQAGSTSPTTIGGWPADDRVVARAQGKLSESTAPLMAKLFDRLPGLRERLDRPGASMLDVGAGAAGLCVALARSFPELRVIGIEPSAEALAEARSVVASAGLGRRIALRQQLGEDMDDDGLHTAAWVAQMFVPDAAIEAVWRATLRALELGGVLITVAIARTGDDFFSAITRWRNAGWGGGVRTAEVVVAQLEAAGFVDVAALPTPESATAIPIVARKPTPSDA
jgi:precorrin-6B methylase 2